MHLVMLHSHPFDTSSNPWFSPHDRDMMNGLSRMITGLYPEMTAMFAVFSEKGVIASIHNPETEERDLLPVTVVGNGKLETPLELSNEYTYDSEYSDTGIESGVTIDTSRYDRSIRALGEDGQKRLADTHIALIGAGGLGSIMAQQFARYGIGHLTIIDDDRVEKSNLPRLFGAYDYHIDRPKVEAIKEQLWRDNPGIEVTAIQDRVENTEDALKDVDLIVAGVDKASTRIWLNVFAVQHLIPYVDAGVVIKLEDGPGKTEQERRISTMEGYIQFIQPGANGCMNCIDRTDPEQAYIDELSEEELEEQIERGYIDETALSPVPAVAPLNGQIAAKTVQLVAKHLTGYAPPENFLRIETVDNTVNQLTTRPRSGCTICGEHGVLGMGDREPTDADLETLRDRMEDRDTHLNLDWEHDQLLDEQHETGEVEASLKDDDRFAAFYNEDGDAEAD
jgi:molybdopterin/thiamine biosynthesis adenylyltransferase